MGLYQGSVSTLVGCELWGPFAQNLTFRKSFMSLVLVCLMCLVLVCLMCICWFVLCVGFSVLFAAFSLCYVSFHGLCYVCRFQLVFEGQLSE